MELNATELAALEASTVRIGIFFRLDTDPPVRLWLGFGDIQPGVNVYDPIAGTYHGLGEIGNLPSIKQLINGRAERIEFSISGVSGQVLSIASGGDAEQVKGKRAAIGFALMAPDWSLLGTVKWCANYTADYLTLRQDVMDPTQSVVRTISLSCGSMLTSRRRPGRSYFTNQDQQARHPGDTFCERVSKYANGFTKTWPHFPPA